MHQLLEKAGLTPDILRDPSRRSSAIREYNAKAGGLRDLMRGGTLAIAVPEPIPSEISGADWVRFLRYVKEGRRVPILFAAGRATRLELPRDYDRFGIAGLTPKTLAALGEAAPLALPRELSFIQRQLLQLHCQMKGLLRANPEAGVSLEDWLEKAKFAVVTNEENKFELALQLAAIHFAGLKPEHVYVLVQPEEGGLEILADGTTRVFDKEVWPEGHGKPFLDMNNDATAGFRLNARGHLVPLKKTLVSEFSSQGVERAVFAQVNDLHLLEDMVHAERWLAADALIQRGAEMVLEMVENGLGQKGGGIFLGGRGHVVMRDSIAMQSADLEAYAVPKSLSRMFYELTVRGLSKLHPGILPEYLTERKTSGGKNVLTREYYSGDASSVLAAQAVQQGGYALDTFKMRSRVGAALEAMRRQDAQEGFLRTLH